MSLFYVLYHFWQSSNNTMAKKRLKCKDLFNTKSNIIKGVNDQKIDEGSFTTVLGGSGASMAVGDVGELNTGLNGTSASGSGTYRT